MQLKIFILKFITSKKVNLSSTFLRGYFSQRFKHIPLLHQHNDKKLIYSYPLVQYKIIDGYPMILGINEGVEILREIYRDIDTLELDKNSYKVLEKQIIEKESEFGTTDNSIHYKFLIPYLALNQENYEKYQNTENRRQKTEILEKILIGNILSISKSLSYVVLDEIKVKTRLRQVKTKLKDVLFTGFVGKFEVNFNLPDYIGLGKSTSRGFGTIIKI